MPLAAKQISKKLHLILVNTPGMQEADDFRDISNIIERDAPNIRVFIAHNLRNDFALAKEASLFPTLVVSPAPLETFRPLRGLIHQGKKIPKIIQLQKLEEMSLPIPKWALAKPDLRPKKSEWGEMLIIKSSYPLSAHGQAVSVVATDKYVFTPPEEYPEGHFGREWPMIVQNFIDTGEFANNYRVLTLYGEALYCDKSTLTMPAPRPGSIGEEVTSDAVATNVTIPGSNTFRFVSDPDVLELAKRAHFAFPEVPAKGIDIVRDHKTGKLYVLELNCVAVWHISSSYFRKFRVDEFTKQNMVAQFDAWEVAAKALIKRTRMDAV